MSGLQERLSGIVGGRTAKAMADAFGLNTVEDLLLHLPRRYARRGELTKLGALSVDEHVTVLADVASVTSRPMRGRRGNLLEVVVTDGQDQLALTFFNQQWRKRELQMGRRGLFAGKVGDYRGRLQLTHPDYLLLPTGEDVADGAGEEEAASETQDFLQDYVPVYRATSAMPSWTVARSVALVLQGMAWDEIQDPVPPEVRSRIGLLGLGEAFRSAHRPVDEAEIEAARERLRFDEAWLVQLVLALRRREWESTRAVARPARSGGIVDRFRERLPFELTAGQASVAEDIDADLASEHPMHRLLQGDVGSGKTVVALLAMLRVVDGGGQAVLLAPTEVLAAQHYHSLKQLLGPLVERGLLGGDPQGTGLVLLTGSLNAAARRRTLLDMASGAAGLVVGTHALLSDPVQFADLGLVVVDEQHRFGVEQRAALADKAATGGRSHVLVMTATPIPRTVAMTVFGDLEVSTLREIPSGRAGVVTHVVPALDKPAYVDRMWQRIREEVGEGRQVYIVCPRIDEEPDGDTPTGSVRQSMAAGADAAAPLSSGWTSVVALSQWLQRGPLAGLRLAELHGRMPADDKQTVMSRFAAGGQAEDGIDVLVATTVIEVGVDVPNASVMVVMDSDRYGVSQLHQLRGRVGRGAHPGLCLLHTLAESDGDARARLDAVAKTTDGFALSLVDLEQRREGDVLGAAQSGRLSSLRLLSVLRDEEVIAQARSEAEWLLGQDPHLETHAALLEKVERWRADERAEFAEKS